MLNAASCPSCFVALRRGVLSASLRNWDIDGRVTVLKQWDIRRSEPSESQAPVVALPQECLQCSVQDPPWWRQKSSAPLTSL